MTQAFIAIGSNINPAANVEAALHKLAVHVPIVAISTVYQTEPEGPPGQPPFYNCVIEIDTNLPPRDLKFSVLRRIESELGRTRGADKYAARTIDLDLVLYDDLAIETNDLVLPDPEIQHRAFLAIPLKELAPGLVLADSRCTISDIAAALPADGLRPLTEYTEKLHHRVKLV